MTQGYEGTVTEAVQVTQMQAHANQLNTLHEGLQRALLQYENMLDRLCIPKAMTAKDQQEGNPTEYPLIPRINESMTKLLELSDSLNKAADELNGII